MYNTALSLMQHAEDAEDVAQEVFVSVYQNIGGFRREAKLSTWLYRITVTKSLGAIRKGKRRKQRTDPGGLGDLDDRPGTAFHHPGVLAENRERAAILFAALAGLPENQKTAFVLHNTEGLSYAEISAVMEMSISAVESLIYRARRNLQKRLASFYERDKE